MLHRSAMTNPSTKDARNMPRIIWKIMWILVADPIFPSKNEALLIALKHDWQSTNRGWSPAANTITSPLLASCLFPCSCQKIVQSSIRINKRNLTIASRYVPPFFVIRSWKSFDVSGSMLVISTNPLPFRRSSLLSDMPNWFRTSLSWSGSVKQLNVISAAFTYIIKGIWMYVFIICNSK